MHPDRPQSPRYEHADTKSLHAQYVRTLTITKHSQFSAAKTGSVWLFQILRAGMLGMGSDPARENKNHLRGAIHRA
jgi:hypothetical protein